jgi:hypothetical protein
VRRFKRPAVSIITISLFEFHFGAKVSKATELDHFPFLVSQWNSYSIRPNLQLINAAARNVSAAPNYFITLLFFD